MEEVTVGALGSILPEIALLVGGLVILILDAASAKEDRASGAAYMVVAVLFLVIALAGAVLQMLAFMSGTREPMSALSMVDIDPFAAFFKVTIYAGMALVAIAGGSYMNKRAEGRGEFWTLFVFVTLAMGMAVSANNLLLLFLSIEFLSITSYILAGFMREDDRSSEAGVKYFLYGSVASSVMLYGMSLLYGAAGSIYLVDIGAALLGNEELAVLALPAVLLTLVGFGFKTSLAPFYQWAPDTYEGAPTPVTAYLSTASKTVGFAVLVRVFIVALGGFQTEWVPILAGLSILTMTLGNLIALRQTNVKRMLAYSSVAQAGYMLMGLVAVVSIDKVSDISALGINGINGLLIYLFAYLFTNVGAFMVVMAVEETVGSTDVDDFRGLYRRAPSLAIAMLIFLLSLTGIPLTGGFIGKLYVFGAAVQHQYFWLAAFGVVNVAISAGYYLRVAGAMFLGLIGDGDGLPTSRLSVTIPIQLALTICVLATLWIGIYPAGFTNWADTASRVLLSFAVQG